MTNNVGLYVHIPFCLSKCIYCDFLSFANKDDLFERYCNALSQEMRHYGKKIEDHIDTVYVGGGTPTILPAFLIEKIACAAKKYLRVMPNAEITIEANPATVDEEKAFAIANAGFNRVSIGMQSADDSVLKFLGRAHDKKQFEQTVRLFFNAGMTNVNADFLLGVPDQTVQSVKDTVGYLANIGVTHISAYSLIVEKGTPLFKSVKNGSVVLPDDDFVVDLYDAFLSEAQKHGYLRYEVSNFAKKGFESKHNVNCWKYRPYVGVGLGAQSFFGGRRFGNVKNIDNYIKRIESGKSAVSSGKKLTADEMMFEFIMLGLRLEEGFAVDEFEDLFKTDFFVRYGNIIERLTAQGLVEYSDGRVRVKSEKFYILNSIITEFII